MQTKPFRAESKRYSDAEVFEWLSKGMTMNQWEYLNGCRDVAELDKEIDMCIRLWQEQNQ